MKKVYSSNFRLKPVDRFASQFHSIDSEGISPFEKSTQDLTESVREALKFLCDRIVRRVGKTSVIRRVDYSRVLLHEKLICEMLEDAKIDNEVRSTVLRCINIVERTGENKEDTTIPTKELTKKGLTYENIAKLQEKHGHNVLMYIANNWAKIVVVLENVKYIVKIGLQSYGEEKLKRICNCASQLNAVVSFNGYHLSQIVVGAGWEEKLKEALKVCEFGKTPTEFSAVCKYKDWEKRISRECDK